MGAPVVRGATRRNDQQERCELSDSKIIVTGVAGFVGSTLATHLLAGGARVIGVDCLTDYYDTRIKERNIAPLLDHDNFQFIRKPILEVDWAPLLDGCATVYHQAAQAGVRASWGASFECYTTWNVLSTQHLLEAMKGTGARMVYASSSSVYGETKLLPMSEEHRPQPMSPYGVTKLAAEHLASSTCRNFRRADRFAALTLPSTDRAAARHGLSQVHPRRRAGQTDHLYGRGEQTRDFTVIRGRRAGNLLAAERGTPGGVYNIGGGSRSRSTTSSSCSDRSWASRSRSTASSASTAT